MHVSPTIPRTFNSHTTPHHICLRHAHFRRDAAAPFRTVARAQAAVRAHRTTAMGDREVAAVEERATVQISGLCELEATLQLDDPTLGEYICCTCCTPRAIHRFVLCSPTVVPSACARARTRTDDWLTHITFSAHLTHTLTHTLTHSLTHALTHAHLHQYQHNTTQRALPLSLSRQTPTPTT
jgi:hypothetical protein